VWAQNRAGTDVPDFDVFARVLGTTEDELISCAAPPQRNVRLATNGDTTLAAWLESRTSSLSQVRVGCFTRDGVPLDGEGIVVGAQAVSLSATFDGRNYIVAWGSPTNAGFPDRVSWDGSDARPRIAWSGSRWLVAWEHTKPLPPGPNPPTGAPPPAPSHDVRAARLTPSLELLDPVEIVIANTPSGDATRPSVASNGIDFLVAWSDRELGIRARRVASDGTLGDPVAFSRGTAPSVAMHGSDYVVAWIDRSDIVVAPLAAPSLRVPLAASADGSSGVTLLGTFAAYDRLNGDDVPRGFLRAYTLARPRPARH